MCCWFKKLKLTHPQEPPDLTATLASISVQTVVQKWLEDWKVPAQFWSYWKNEGVIITVRNDISYPAMTYSGQDGKRHLDVQPAWLNPGVIAHEQAHNSYALLTAEQKAEFSAAYTPLKTADKLIAFLYQHNTYGLVSDVEGHAEVYRYLTQSMPKSLYPCYPRLLEVLL